MSCIFVHIIVSILFVFKLAHKYMGYSILEMTSDISSEHPFLYFTLLLEGLTWYPSKLLSFPPIPVLTYGFLCYSPAELPQAEPMARMRTRQCE